MKLSILEILSLLSILLAVYTFFLYPFVLKTLAKLFYKPVKRDYDFKPDITILIAAYNEENYIENCILSVLNSDYPIEKIKIFVGIDGKTDDTDLVIQKLQKSFNNIQYWIFDRGGKNLTINKLLEKVETEYIAFTDADIRINKDSISKLISYFSNSNIGGVMSGLRINDSEKETDNSGREGEATYQNIESVLRNGESQIWGTINALGALYIINKKYIEFQPNSKVCDDLFNFYVVAKNKKRFIFVKDDIVVEVREKSLSAEINRRVRTVSGGIAAAVACWQVLMPNYGWSSFFLWSHKIFRYFSPLIIIFLLVVTIVLPLESILKIPYIISFSSFAILVIIGYLAEIMGLENKILRLGLFVFTMNIGFLKGIISFLKGDKTGKWEKIG